LKAPHADSAFEEAQVKGRTGYFIIAILLTRAERDADSSASAEA
jgi:hypothetical protein